MISMNKEYHFGALRKGLNAVKEAWGKKKKEEGAILFADCLVGGGYCAGWFMCKVFILKRTQGGI